MNEDLLLIFVRNPVLHQVKTRLAATVGPEKALAVYQSLLNHTREVTKSLPAGKMVFYADYVPAEDFWEEGFYQKELQQGRDLGERMYNAFKAGFALGYRRICIIGSDCFELTAEIISQAFAALREKEVVVGPATDGGYYLLGMNQIYPALFNNITWSTPEVLTQTLEIARANNISVALLPTLTDIDEEKDLATMPHYR